MTHTLTIIHSRVIEMIDATGKRLAKRVAVALMNNKWFCT